MKKEFLPIGSVVRLKGATKKLMITGFYVKAEEFDKVFDYSGCVYPEGIVSSNENAVFNQDQIEEIVFTGFVNEEEMDFKEKLYSTINQLEGNKTEVQSDLFSIKDIE